MSNLEESNETNNKKTMFQNMKTVPKLLYNTTIGEMRNARIPILDSAYRSVYRKSFNPDTTKGNIVFPKSEGYYKLGGKYYSGNRRRIKKTKKSRTTKKTTRTRFTRKNKK